ncbi:MAG TPA: hypothetical protein VJ420_05710 [Candidatus Udaeobacter sp.]|nr:hypothetical protein [Candidatus Udaeobacter sp.]
MATVTSKWAVTAPALTGTFSPGEWTVSGVLPMPGGFIHVKNDASFLYLAIDITNDTGQSPGVGDYFWLSFDVDRSGSITPHFDVNYGIYPSLPIKIAKQYYLGPGTWTGILGGFTPSKAQHGFAASPHSGTPHRIWEMRIALSELGIVALGAMTLPYVRFGLRVASTTPSFVTDFPPSFFTNFASLHTIYLATGPDPVYPPGTAGPVIGGVGLIPFTTITGGRATTAPGYYPPVTDAAFGSVLNFIYNRPTIQSLWAAGARRYAIVHRFGSSGSFTALRRTWSNYRWNGTTYVLDPFGPDASDTYELKDPTFDYSTKDLLFQLNTTGGSGDPAIPTGIHEFQVQFHKAGGGAVASPPQTLQLYVDNALPELQIYEIRYMGATVAPCSIVDIAETADPVQVHFRAFDPEGDLLTFALYAYYGGPFTPAINLLPAGMGAYPGGNWQGVADQWINCPVTPDKFPPVSCAYQFRLWCTPRVTNGYNYIGYNEVTSHVTFRRPGVPPFAVAKQLVVPFGFKPSPEGFHAVAT